MYGQKALALLKNMLGQRAEFRSGQIEAIQAAAEGKRVLVVQQTGWGKSIVYFIATKLRRQQGKGVTVLISPLLALMRNQIDSANTIGLCAVTINSDNQDEWDHVKNTLKDNKCDILLLSPERLANDDFKDNVLPYLNIGMFVVDEAHCISDWGHDFRPDYQRIVSIVKALPPNVPVLATTATANNRVVDDIRKQLGENLQIHRGSLVRNSLRLQVIKLNDQAERLAWLDENLNKMPGTGIIYCLTTGDCEKVTKWLKLKGHKVEAYHSRLPKDKDGSEIREEREKMLMDNKVKALVATLALGMGYDKPDIGFVIHYQRPGNLIAYYQQIGRAGRNLDNAYAILLNGQEDDDIQEYFINSAFPTEEDMVKVLDVIADADYGVNSSKIMSMVNMKKGKVDKVLKFLSLQKVIVKDGYNYIRTANEWLPDREKSAKITEIRYEELENIKNFIDTDKCLMKYVADNLDDTTATACQKCSNCIGHDYFSKSVNKSTVLEAVKFLRQDFIVIEPRKVWPAGWDKEERGHIAGDLQVAIGRALCNYGDAGWGKYIKEDKYKHKYFRDELVEASANLIQRWDMTPKPTWITAVPSLRDPQLVYNFAVRLAKKLKLPFHPCIKKVKETPPQKTMENSNLQAANIYDCFNIEGVCPSGPVLLIDDMVDSKWTFTVCGAMLRKNGSDQVYPFALASTAGGE